MRVLFLVRDLHTSVITRALPFAELLAQRHSACIIAPAKGVRALGWSSKTARIIPLKKKFGFFAKVLRIGIGFDAICVSKPAAWSALAGFFFRLAGKRVIVDIDDEETNIIKQDIEHLEKIKVPALKKFFLRLRIAVQSASLFLARRTANQITVASPELQRLFGGTVLAVPFDAALFKNAKGIAKPKGKKTVMYLGGIKRFKGIEQLIDAFAIVKKSVPQARLVLAGTAFGNVFPGEITERARRASSSIEFTGFVPLESSYAMLLSADCLVLPNPDNSIHSFQLPIKLIQYMGAGRPIVATRVGFVPQILENGECGIIVEAGSPKAMAEGIASALCDNRLARKISGNARKKFADNYSFDSMRDAVEKIYCG